MIHVETAIERPWLGGNWEALTVHAVRAASEASAHGDIATLSTVVEVSIRYTSVEEVRTLNHSYRQKDKPTNVLSFPMVQPDLLDAINPGDDDGETLLGDIVLAHGVCAREAQEKNVSVEDHAAHLIVHGTLHLLGYDHHDDGDAADMEAREIRALHRLGIANPYEVAA